MSLRSNVSLIVHANFKVLGLHALQHSFYNVQGCLISSHRYAHWVKVFRIGWKQIGVGITWEYYVKVIILNHVCFRETSRLAAILSNALTLLSFFLFLSFSKFSQCETDDRFLDYSMQLSFIKCSLNQITICLLRAINW